MFLCLVALARGVPTVFRGTAYRCGPGDCVPARAAARAEVFCATLAPVTGCLPPPPRCHVCVGPIDTCVYMRVCDKHGRWRVYTSTLTRPFRLRSGAVADLVSAAARELLALIGMRLRVGARRALAAAKRRLRKYICIMYMHVHCL